MIKGDIDAGAQTLEPPGEPGIRVAPGAPEMGLFVGEQVASAPGDAGAELEVVGGRPGRSLTVGLVRGADQQLIAERVDCHRESVLGSLPGTGSSNSRCWVRVG